MHSLLSRGNRRPVRAAVLTSLAVVASLVTLVTPASADTGYSAWQMSGDDGEFITAGATHSYAPPTTAFSISGSAAAVYITAIQPGFAHFWYADFRAVAGESLTAGTTYVGVERAAVASAGHPGLDISGDGRSCNTVTGTFTVNEIATDPDTGDLLRFAATFEQHCEGLAPAARGTILYNATDPLPLVTTTTLTGPTTVAPGLALTLDGTLSDTTGPLASTDLTVSRSDGSGTTDLGTVTTDSAGAFTLADTIGSSDATYTASYAGDSTHQPSSKSLSVVAAKNSSALTISAPSTGIRGQSFDVTGTLTSKGAGVAGGQISIKRIDAAGTTTSTVTTNGAGTYTLSDVPAVGGNVHFTASWAGDASRTPSTSPLVTVVVERHTTDITIRASASLYTYGGRGKVLAHLGPTYNGRWVSIYARPLGTSVTAPGTLIAHGKVNSNGDLSVYYTMTRRTTFSAVFYGDYRYLPASASVTSTVTSRVTLTFARYSGKSGSYYVYRGQDPLVRVGVSPVRTSGCAAVLAEIYSAGKWQRTASLECAHLDTTSHAYVTFTSNRHVGSKYRMRASVAAGTYGTSGSTGWVYWTYR